MHDKILSVFYCVVISNFSHRASHWQYVLFMLIVLPVISSFFDNILFIFTNLFGYAEQNADKTILKMFNPLSAAAAGPRQQCKRIQRSKG